MLYFVSFQNFCIFNESAHGGFGNDLIIRTETKNLVQGICKFCTGVRAVSYTHLVVGWKQFTNPRHFAGYGRQKGWERDNQPVATGTNTLGGSTELTEEEIKQMELPF